ncbi:hypothetical protein KUH32_03310 [Thalassococcus sp. CAU 1522]|uniref:Porin n=1 Tax=Thalassococcus arenae TaxID=2851652 RepID=A0ABS6N450_9RHOB|nr:hypothetical protein [Thalassococcus arenae]MBV2358790.1 hypothetical protein [Thalassococcus arenae]
MSKHAVALVAGIAVATPALAQNLDYSTAVGLSYTSFNAEGENADGISLFSETELRFGQFSADFDLGFDTLKDDGAELRNFSMALAPRYWVTDTIGLGVYVARDSIDADVGDIVNLDSYGIEATFRNAVFEGNLFVGQTDLDELSGIVDVTDLGFRVRADLGDQASLWGSGVRSTFEAGGDSLHASSFGVGADFAFTDTVSGFVSYRQSSVDDADISLDTTGFGLSYTATVGSRPVVFSGEYAKVSGDDLVTGLEGERLSIGATLLLGDARRKRTPGHTVSSSVLNGERSALSGLLGGVGF